MNLPLSLTVNVMNKCTTFYENSLQLTLITKSDLVLLMDRQRFSSNPIEFSFRLCKFRIDSCWCAASGDSYSMVLNNTSREVSKDRSK